MDITGLQSLNPEIARKAQSIQNMPPDKAIQMLLANGVDSRTAAMVMKNMLLKKAAAQQAKAQPAPKTVSQDIDDQVNRLTTPEPHPAGVVGLHVPDSMFPDAKGLAGGGIVAFDDGGPVESPTNPTDYSAMVQYQVAQNMANQQGLAGLAAGGKVRHFAKGDYIAPEDQIDPNTGYRLGDYENMPHSSGFPDFGNVLQTLSPYSDPPTAPTTPVSAEQAAAQNVPQDAPNQGPPRPPGIAGAQLSGAPNPNPQPQGLPPAGGPGGGGQSVSASASMPNQGNLQAVQQQMQNQIAQQQAMADANKPKSPDEILENIRQQAATQGIGAAAATHLQEIEQQKDALKNLAGQNKWLAMAQAGFAMTQAATQNPHGGFLGALAVGGQVGAQQYGKALADYHAGMAKLQDQSYQVKQAQENLAYDQTKMAQKEYEDQVNRYDRLQGVVVTAQDRMTASVWGKELQIMNNKAQMKIAEMQAANTWKGPASDAHMKEWEQAFVKANGREPTGQEWAAEATPVYGSTSGVQSAGIRAQASEANNAANNETKRAQLRQQLYTNSNYNAIKSMSTIPGPHQAEYVARVRKMEAHPEEYVDSEVSPVQSTAAQPKRYKFDINSGNLE